MHAVRLVAPKIGLDQRVRREPRIGFRHAGADIDGGREIEQAVGRDAHLLVHGPSSPSLLPGWASVRNHELRTEKTRADVGAGEATSNGFETVPVETMLPFGSTMPRSRAVATRSARAASGSVTSSPSRRLPASLPSTLTTSPSAKSPSCAFSIDSPRTSASNAPLSAAKLGHPTARRSTKRDRTSSKAARTSPTASRTGNRARPAGCPD